MDDTPERIELRLFAFASFSSRQFRIVDICSVFLTVNLVSRRRSAGLGRPFPFGGSAHTRMTRVISEKLASFMPA